MPRSSRLALLTLAASFAVMVTSACDPEPTIVSPQDTEQELPKDEEVDPRAEVVPDNTEAIPVPAFQGLGEEEGVELIPVGTLSGTWRVAMTNPSKNPVMHVDFVHDQGATTATCDFVMYWNYQEDEDRIAYFPDKIGKCEAVTLQGSALTLLFNPTEQVDYAMTLTANLTDEDTFTGRITAPDQGGEDVWDVTIERRQFDASDDGVRPAQ